MNKLGSDLTPILTVKLSEPRKSKRDKVAKASHLGKTSPNAMVIVAVAVAAVVCNGRYNHCRHSSGQ